MKRYCGRHTQGRMLISVANEWSCTKVFETVFILNLSFETKKLWLKIRNITYAHMLVFARIYWLYCTAFCIERIYVFWCFPLKSSLYALCSCYWSNFFTITVERVRFINPSWFELITPQVSKLCYHKHELKKISEIYKKYFFEKALF